MEIFGPSFINDGGFILHMKMAGTMCPGCGELREPGECDACGAQVPESEELSEMAVARRSALSQLMERAKAIAAQCEQDIVPGARMTGEQLAGAIDQSGLIELLPEAGLSAQRLSSFDLDEKATLGAGLRKAVEAELVRTEKVVHLCLELASFEPTPPQPEIRDELRNAATRTISVLLSFLEAVTAQTILELHEAKGRLQKAILASSGYESLAERVEVLKETVDLDARISVATGRVSSYFDAFGFLSPAQIFGAFAGEEEAHERLADAACAYFDHLLADRLEEGVGSIAILSAVGLASVDRPLLAQRSAVAMADLVAQAVSVDVKAVVSILSGSVTEAPKLFAAASRVRTGMRLVALAGELEESEIEIVLREVMTGYVEIAESAFRSYARAVLRLVRVLDGESPDECSPPMLGSLVERLRASRSALARALGDAADPALRNAAAHAQYRWTPETEEVEDLETGRRWSVDDLTERTEALGGAVIGVDAGYLCGVLVAGIETPVANPDRHMRESFLAASFALAGYELTEVRDDGSTVVVRPGDAADVPSLMGAIASQSALVTDADGFCVVDADSSKVLLEVSAEQMFAATRGREATRDLEVVRCFTDSSVSTGAPMSARQGLVVQAKIVAVTSLRALAYEGANDSVVGLIRTRAEAVLGFIESHREIGRDTREAAQRRVGGIVGATFQLQRDRGRGLKGLLRKVRSTWIWADRQGVVWPPESQPVLRDSSEI
jgi:uncharacterized protein YbjQ (UPF0145 family)